MKAKYMDTAIRKYIVSFLVCVLLLQLAAVCGVMPVEAANGSDSSSVGSSIDYSIWTLDLPTGGILASGDLKKLSYNGWWYRGSGAFEGYTMFQTPQK
ncbi:MAG: hypothetical protein LBI79_04395, partial [Nitrososphaerota archaeon]|nr:hypothetical protein [Nitrososphaerota archaeon]